MLFFVIPLYSAMYVIRLIVWAFSLNALLSNSVIQAFNWSSNEFSQFSFRATQPKLDKLRDIHTIIFLEDDSETNNSVCSFSNMISS
jgi:hypothetical protein